eukprot:CAMPEP_0194365868 /NCGR_PEP_ID=MMETSP0174-20130528/13850_1 /TAXON_ID=216777 /ORGANISM="Proboscia alata, Strain PI-D3" /LENGTH=111 /DNA_ID=CAMNT_0039140719 /DNA_START=33 /DNA_END=365 /DNA_ORIENTATION=+
MKTNQNKITNNASLNDAITSSTAAASVGIETSELSSSYSQSWEKNLPGNCDNSSYNNPAQKDEKESRLEIQRMLAGQSTNKFDASLTDDNTVRRAIVRNTNNQVGNTNNVF